MRIERIHYRNANSRTLVEFFKSRFKVKKDKPTRGFQKFPKNDRVNNLEVLQIC